MRLTFTVHGPPVPKARPRVVAGGRRTFTPAKTLAYQTAVATRALAARQRLSSPWPREARYRVTLEVRGASPTADLDNIVKTCLDACNAVLWDDDRQVDEIHATRCADGEGLMMLVETL